MSCDDHLLLACSSETVWLWDTPSGCLRQTLRAPGARLQAAALSFDGRLGLLAGHRDLLLLDTGSGGSSGP